MAEQPQTPPPQEPPPQQPPGATLSRNTTTGVLALVFGVLQFFALPVVGTIIALVTGYMSRSEAQQNPALSDDFGRVGRVLGWIGLALMAGILILVILVLIMGFAWTM